MIARQHQVTRHPTPTPAPHPQHPAITLTLSPPLYISRLLLEHGADVNKAQHTTGVTPLFMAAQFGHDAVVRYALWCGVMRCSEG